MRKLTRYHIRKDECVKLTPEFTDADGKRAENLPSLRVRSSKPSVATVPPHIGPSWGYVVTAVAPGTAIISTYCADEKKPNWRFRVVVKA